MTTDRRGGFPIGLTIAVAIAFAILIGLGTWQVQRLEWKRDLLDRIAALEAAPSRPLAVVLAAGGDLDFVRVTAACPGLAKAAFVELYAIRDGQAGSRIVSACRVGTGSILVDRGFVADTVSARPPVDPADTTPLQVTGVLRMPEAGNAFSPPNKPPRFFTRDVPAMAAALGAPAPAPPTLMAETPTNPEWAALVPAPIPAEIANRHLEYALTWYGLAAALLGVYAAMLLRAFRRGGDRLAAESPPTRSPE